MKWFQQIVQNQDMFVKRTHISIMRNCIIITVPPANVYICVRMGYERIVHHIVIIVIQVRIF